VSDTQESHTATDAIRAETDRLAAVSPMDGRMIGHPPPEMSRGDVTALARRLREAQPEWEAIGAKGRARWLGGSGTGSSTTSRP